MNHIEWLEKQVQEAERELAIWKEALRLARRKEEKTSPESQDIQMEIPGLEKEKRKSTIVNLAEEIIREKGPLKTKELLEYLKERGKDTTLNSLTVSLNQKKGKIFTKNDDKKWYLVEQDRNELIKSSIRKIRVQEIESEPESSDKE